MNTAFCAALEAAGFGTEPAGRARLALALGVDATTVWRWMTGKSTPSSDGTYAALARELRRTTQEIRAMFDRDLTSEAA